jgi:phage tail sheath protein FI
MATYKTPGVYIVEKDAFPNSVVEVPTAVPAFIGYTQFAINGTKSLLNTPYRVSSLAEFHQHFGYAPDYTFEVKKLEAADKAKASYTLGENFYSFTQTGVNYFLYRSMRMFFDNGGGPCYIVSIGDYKTALDTKAIELAIDLLRREQEPTMVVAPDLMAFPTAGDIYALQGKIVDHCGYQMQSRFAILDLYNGWKSTTDPDGNPVKDFRDKMASDFLKYSAAYYPWVYSTVVAATDLTYQNVSVESRQVFEDLLKEEVKMMQARKLIDDAKAKSFNDEIELIVSEPNPEKPVNPVVLHNTLQVISPAYVSIMSDFRKTLNLLPPSGAMAGIYTRVDNSRGVWKAPANVTMASVVSPAVNITSEDQEDLNVSLQGKSINAIRTFIGEGTLVWGARTLDGNSQDWRYVSVRRTMIMLEQSIKAACKAYVFEPNDANTWVSVKSMISNYLTAKWKDGALVGAKPDEAYEVSVGLGSTMTANDILDGMMNVTVKVAISRPAEFIVITFQQQMQKS